MSDECIHGFASGLCASCFPKAAPEAPARPRAAKPRTSRARETTTPTTLRSAHVAASPPARTSKSPAARAAHVVEQRIYHLTHITNLPAILDAGALLADASGSIERADLDISSTNNREARRTTVVPGRDSRSVADYVPFFLSPDAGLWNSIRSREADPRLAPDIDHHATFDFVVLVSTVGKAHAHVAAGAGTETGSAHAGVGTDDTAAVTVTDGDAASSLTRFGSTAHDRERMLRALRADQEPEAILGAEFLVADSFPFELVSLIGVANDKVREAVRGILASSGYSAKVAVYPPWFQPGGGAL